MKKKSLIFGFMLAAASIMSHAMASDAYHSVIVTSQSGETYSFSLEGEGVKAGLSGDKLIISNATKQIELPTTETARFEFSTEDAGTDTAIGSNAAFSILDASLTARGLEAGSQVTIFNTSGQAIAAGHCDEQGYYSSPALGKGIYIASTKKLTFKFIIK